MKNLKLQSFAVSSVQGLDGLSVQNVPSFERTDKEWLSGNSINFSDNYHFMWRTYEYSFYTLLQSLYTITYKSRLTQKKLYKKTMLFLASMGETGLTHDIFFEFSLRPFEVVEAEGGRRRPILRLKRPKWEFKKKCHGIIPFLP